MAAAGAQGAAVEPCEDVPREPEDLPPVVPRKLHVQPVAGHDEHHQQHHHLHHVVALDLPL
eukprot:52062-Eustigmatos_ZCMA.PRE.1